VNILIVGFDSAWTDHKRGAIAGALVTDCGCTNLKLPQPATFIRAQELIIEWQQECQQDTTIVLIDQPTIVPNAKGQRPVENIASSVIGRRGGGMQPANRGRVGMFCENAPIWGFLDRFGGAANPRSDSSSIEVYETYPVLAMIALQWTIENNRPSGRLPKYNPERRKTFSMSDWKHVCAKVADEFRNRGLVEFAQRTDELRQKQAPRKADQDCLDASICLLVALDMAAGKRCLMIGDVQTGYIIVPYSEALCFELNLRCEETARDHVDWVRGVTRNRQGGPLLGAGLTRMIVE